MWFYNACETTRMRERRSPSWKWLSLCDELLILCDLRLQALHVHFRDLINGGDGLLQLMSMQVFYLRIQPLQLRHGPLEHSAHITLLYFTTHKRGRRCRTQRKLTVSPSPRHPRLWFLSCSFHVVCLRLVEQTHGPPTQWMMLFVFRGYLHYVVSPSVAPLEGWVYGTA